MNKNFKDVMFFSIIFLIIDQAIKFYLKSKMVVGQSLVVIENFFNITYVRNKGAAFSMFENNQLLLIIIGLAFTIGLIIYINNLAEITDFDMFCYSLLLGGTLGNLVDRIIHGYVIDYLSLNIFGYHFPIFNFADMCIVISIVLIFWSAFKGDLWRE